MLTFKSNKTRLRIALRGQGVAPEVALTPDGVTTNGLDFGDVLQGEKAEATFTVANVCDFDVDYRLRFLGQPDGVDGAGAVPDPGRRTFYCRPEAGRIPPGASQVVTVVFGPGYQAPYFADRLQLVIPFQPADIIVPVRGRGWAEGVFLSGPEYPKLVADPLQLQGASPLPVDAGAAAAAPAGAGAPLLDLTSPAPRTLTLTFPDGARLGQTLTHALTVGCLKSAVSGAGAAGELALDDLTPADKEAGWSVDAAKLPLAPGDRKAVTFKFTAPRVPSPTTAAFYGLREFAELRLGATLKGGLPAPPGGPDGRRIVLLVRCAINPPVPGEEPLPPPAFEPVAGKKK
jgi:hypothetical protein